MSSLHQIRHSSGVTLIELVTTMAVAAILLALALPSFTSAITRNRLTSQANELAATFALARTEALRRNRDVSVCASANGSACSASWEGGWMVWVDDNRNGAFDSATDPVLRVGQFSVKDEAVAKDGVAQVSFNFRGRRTAPAAGTDFEFRVHPDGYVCADDGVEYERVVTVSSAGIINARKLPTCS